MSKRLLREYYELCDGGSCPDVLTEAERKFVASGGVMLSGKLQEAEARNGNGRVYPKKILEREMGKIKVLGTPSGKILQELVKAGVKLGISSRGLGSVTEDKGDTIVEDDFQLICFDMVSEPSTNDAFMLQENKQHKNPNIFTKADKINRLLNQILRDD